MNWKKWIATAMLPVVIIWLSGFGQGSISYAQEQKAEAEILELALKKLTSAESMRSNLVMDMDIEVFRLRTGIEASMDMVSFRSPMKIKSVPRVIGTSMVMDGIVSIALCAVTLLWPRVVFGLFTSEAAVLDMATIYLPDQTTLIVT